MPEGDTIRRLADSLSSNLAGQTVKSSLFRHPRLSTVDLAGTTLSGADAYGKHLLMRFSNGDTLHVHLRMTGSVYRRFVGEVPPHRRKFEIEFENAWCTGVDMPILELMRTRDEHRALAHLGPDVCGSYDHSLALARLTAASEIPISQALLDQRIVAGFGNIYAVETPFIVGVSPMTPVQRLSNVDGLLSIAVGLIRTNARFGPQNTTGRRLKLTEHWVLSRNIHLCKICGSKLIRLSGSETPWQRRTAWCAECQAMEPAQVDLARAARLLSLHPCRQIVDLAGGKLTANTSSPVHTLSLRANEGGRKRMK